MEFAELGSFFDVIFLGNALEIMYRSRRLEGCLEPLKTRDPVVSDPVDDVVFCWWISLEVNASCNNSSELLTFSADEILVFSFETFLCNRRCPVVSNYI